MSEAFSWNLKLEPWQHEKKLFSINNYHFTFAEVAKMVGPGWSSLLEDLCVKLLKLGWTGKLAQVKEKFGTLRFYWENDIPDKVLARLAEDVVAQAEWRSGQVCDTCGAYGRLRGKGWLYTSCKEHAKEGDLKDYEMEKEPKNEDK
jgi:hypothetical protein